MQTKKKTQLLTAIIAVLISVSLVALAVYATTTVGNDVSVGGSLTVTGTSTLASTLYVNQATGRVGIGTASPAEKLTVSGNISTDNLYARQTIWTDKLLESSNLQFMRAHHEIGGRSKGDAWTEAGTDVLPVASYGHTSLVYDGKMWMIGGYTAGGYISNVYYSTDGITWTEAGTNALPVATCCQASLVYDGKMWVIGGGIASGVTLKVYYSTDGITWTEAGTDALPVALVYHSSLVYDGKMWVIGGGIASGGITPKVYYSTNGANWTEAGTDALPVATGYHSSLVYDDKMWVIGGYDAIWTELRTVYYSTDGANWTEAGTNALLVGNQSHTSLVYDGKMWVIGGFPAGGRARKVYYSTNGITWTEAGTNALPVGTHDHTSLVYDGKMWVIGGYNDGGYTSKIYYSLPAIKGGLVVQDQSNNELFRITPEGNVGIGTTTPTSTLQVQGSLGFKYTSKNANYTATVNDNIIAVDASSATTTITLPSSSGITGRVYTIKKTDSSSNDVVVDGNASETIDGSATYTLSTQWKYVTIISDGTNWLIITNN